MRPASFSRFWSAEQVVSQPWPSAPRPSAEAVRRRELVIRAGAAGDSATVRAALDDTDARVRASAFRALVQLDALEPGAVADGSRDPDPLVRRTMAELAAVVSGIDLSALLNDPDPSVVETACWAAGEQGSAGVVHLDRLVAIVTHHDDPLCREAGVAALGAVGAEAGLSTILAATGDKATVRRRAVLALAPFSGSAVDAALELALTDRDWQVRQAAEDLLGPTAT